MKYFSHDICRRCMHDGCSNWFGEFDCAITCEVCLEQEKLQELALKKTLSIKDVNEEATVFIIRKRTPHVTQTLIEFISVLQHKVVKKDTRQDNHTRKEVKKKHGNKTK